jgi:hypothetical protein
MRLRQYVRKPYNRVRQQDNSIILCMPPDQFSNVVVSAFYKITPAPDENRFPFDDIRLPMGGELDPVLLE